MVFYNNIDPVMFELSGLEVRYYGIIFVLGFIIGYYMIKKLAKERKLNITDGQVDDFFIWLIISSVIGARLGYIIIYNLSYFLQKPLEMIALWHGGLSFHGGLIGAIVSGIIFARKNKISFYGLADILVIPLSLGLMLGRIANFLNGELYGRVTDLPWAVKFQDAEGFRHPSQIYESLKNLIIFTILWNIRKKDLPKGSLFWLFITLYGTFRFFIEFVRQPDPQIGLIFGIFSMGQLLCIAMIVTGLFFLYRIKKRV